jgi:hypothetical protein
MSLWGRISHAPDHIVAAERDFFGARNASGHSTNIFSTIYTFSRNSIMQER